MTTAVTPSKFQPTNLKAMAPKEIEKLAQNGILNNPKINILQNPKNLKLVANQSQSKPAIVRRNSPSQKG